MKWKRVRNGCYVCEEHNATIIKYFDGWYLTIWNMTRRQIYYSEGACPTLAYAQSVAKKIIEM